jgi:predicted DNA-binding transcriptional regulator YafY
MDTGDLIDAVKAHRAVELHYRGRGGLDTRLVHPHAVYRTASGALRLDGLQVGGATRSGSLPGWRNFDLMRIAEVRVLDAEFQPSADFHRDSEKYRHGLLATA